MDITRKNMFGPTTKKGTKTAKKVPKNWNLNVSSSPKFPI